MKAEEMCVFGGRGAGGRILLRRYDRKFCVFRRREKRNVREIIKLSSIIDDFLSFKVDFVDS
jgi:hypothetical protein